jgi:hypothetical protein
MTLRGAIAVIVASFCCLSVEASSKNARRRRNKPHPTQNGDRQAPGALFSPTSALAKGRIEEILGSSLFSDSDGSSRFVNEFGDKFVLEEPFYAPVVPFPQIIEAPAEDDQIVESSSNDCSSGALTEFDKLFAPFTPPSVIIDDFDILDPSVINLIKDASDGVAEWTRKMEAVAKSDKMPILLRFFIDKLPSGPFTAEQERELESRFKDKPKDQSWIEFMAALKAKYKRQMIVAYQSFFDDFEKKYESKKSHCPDWRSFILEPKKSGFNFQIEVLKTRNSMKDVFVSLSNALGYKAVAVSPSQKPTGDDSTKDTTAMTQVDFTFLCAQVHDSYINRYLFTKCLYSDHVFEKQMFSDHLHHPEQVAHQYAKLLEKTMLVMIDDLKSSEMVEYSSPQSSGQVLGSSGQSPALQLNTAYPDSCDGVVFKLIEFFDDEWIVRYAPLFTCDKEHLERLYKMRTRLLTVYNEMLWTRQVSTLPTDKKERIKRGNMKDLSVVELKGESHRTCIDRIISVVYNRVDKKNPATRDEYVNPTAADWQFLFFNLAPQGILSSKWSKLTQSLIGKLVQNQLVYLSTMRSSQYLKSCEQNRSFPASEEFWNDWLEMDKMAMDKVRLVTVSEITDLSQNMALNLAEYLNAEFNIWRLGVLTGDPNILSQSVSSPTLAYLHFAKKTEIFAELLQHQYKSQLARKELFGMGEAERKQLELVKRKIDLDEIEYYVAPQLRYRVVEGELEWLYLVHTDRAVYGAPPVLRLLFDEQTFSKMDAICKSFLVEVYPLILSVSATRNAFLDRVKKVLPDVLVESIGGECALSTWCSQVFMNPNSKFEGFGNLGNDDKEKKVKKYVEDFAKEAGLISKKMNDKKELFLKAFRTCFNHKKLTQVDAMIVEWALRINAMILHSSPLLIPDYLDKRSTPAAQFDTGSSQSDQSGKPTAASIASYFELVGNQTLHLARLANSAADSFLKFYDKLFVVFGEVVKAEGEGEEVYKDAVFHYRRLSRIVQDVQEECGKKQKL